MNCVPSRVGDRPNTMRATTTNPSNTATLLINPFDTLLPSTIDVNANLARLIDAMTPPLDVDVDVCLNGYSRPPPGGGRRGLVTSILSSYAVSEDREDEDESLVRWVRGRGDSWDGRLGRLSEV
jgi:hypothetical protein